MAFLIVYIIGNANIYFNFLLTAHLNNINYTIIVNKCELIYRLKYNGQSYVPMYLCYYILCLYINA